MKFTDDDLGRLKLQAENICAEQMAPMVHIDGHIVKALLARLEAAENIALAVDNAEFLRKGIDVVNEKSFIYFIIHWIRFDWAHVLRTVKAWRETKGE